MRRYTVKDVPVIPVVPLYAYTRYERSPNPGREGPKPSYSLRHPLYPILSLLLEQCEQATASPDSQSPDTFEADLQSYILRNDNNEKYFFTDNKDLDSLVHHERYSMIPMTDTVLLQMVKAIQVLRIHLIELRKVNELCRDFCSRYINCLKTKIQSDSMFDGWCFVVWLRWLVYEGVGTGRFGRVVAEWVGAIVPEYSH